MPQPVSSRVRAASAPVCGTEQARRRAAERGQLLEAPPPVPASAAPPRAPPTSASAPRKAALDAEDAADGPGRRPRRPTPTRAACRACDAACRRRASASRRARRQAAQGGRRAARREVLRRGARGARVPRARRAAVGGRRLRAVQAAVSGVAVPACTSWTRSRSSRTASPSSRPSSRAAAAPSTSTAARRGPLRDFADGGPIERVNDWVSAADERDQVPRAVPLRHRVPRGVPLAAEPRYPFVGRTCSASSGAPAAQVRTWTRSRTSARRSWRSRGRRRRSCCGRTRRLPSRRPSPRSASIGQHDEVGRPREGPRRRSRSAATRSTAAWSTRRATWTPPPTDEEVAAAAQAAQGRRRRSTAGAGGVDGDCRPVSRDAWDAGSLFLADHRLVHAGRAARSRGRASCSSRRSRCSRPRPRRRRTTTARPVHALLRRGPVHVRREGRGAAPPLARGEAGPITPDTDQSLAVKLLATRGPAAVEEKRRDARRAHARDAALASRNKNGRSSNYLSFSESGSSSPASCLRGKNLVGLLPRASRSLPSSPAVAARSQI